MLAALCVPPDGEASSAAAAAGGGLQRGAWQLYEKKIALHREQLDGTRRQLDTAVNRLNEMQVGCGNADVESACVRARPCTRSLPDLGWCM